jgi:hypothetical protein
MNIDDASVVSAVASEVKELMGRYPLYPELG